MPSPKPASSPESASRTTEVHERFQSGIRLAEGEPESEHVPGDDLEVQASALRVELDAASESQFFCGLEGDVAHGLFVATYLRYRVGQMVHLELAFDDGQPPVPARGIVKWVREASSHERGGVGVALARLPYSARARVRVFCRARPPLYYDDLG